MPKRLSDQQVDQYREQGCTFPVDVLSPNQAAEYLLRLEEAEARYPEAIGPYERNNAHYTFTFLDEIVHQESILDAVEDLIGARILCWGSVLFAKDPQSSAFVSWHQDAAYNGLEPDDAVTAWVALTPSNPSCGCMRYLPGSHHGPVLSHDDRFGEDNILTRGQTINGLPANESTSIDVVLEPGQMSLHHSRLVHGSLPNLSRHRRVGFAVQSYLAPHVHQTMADGDHALLMRGDSHGTFLPAERPERDMDAAAVAFRNRANGVWDSFLYEGAAQHRRY